MVLNHWRESNSVDILVRYSFSAGVGGAALVASVSKVFGGERASLHARLNNKPASCPVEKNVVVGPQTVEEDKATHHVLILGGKTASA